jgi:beta-lactamase regulating signal transducer with metallopeptidase domain
MTIAEFLIALVRANLLAGLAIGVVLILRLPVRRAFGPHFAYALWPAALFAVAGAAIAQAPAGPRETLTHRALTWLALQNHDRLLLAVWIAGVVASTMFAAFSLARFMIAEKAGRAGPAVVGVVVPRLVAPADAAQRFTPQEWRLVRAHERAHMDRQDGRGAAVVVLAQWLCWFNPLLHMAVSALRLDQELACDATVVERHPVERRRYAETLLRAEFDAHTPVYGIGWRGCGALETRLAMLSARAPSLSRLDLGELVVSALWITAFFGGVASQALV